MNTKIFFAALIIVGLPVMAFADTSGNALNQTGWVLTNLNGQSALPEPPITINFEEDKLAGTDGCNRYHGSYTLNADKLNINKNIASTMMACPEPISQQASAYTNALTEAVSYKIDAQQLMLLDASGKTLASFTKQNMELSGTSWLITNVNNGKQAVVSTIIDSKLTANFGTNGRLSGSAGCNNYTASYEISGKNIKIGSIAATRKMCIKAELMEQEAWFLKALETAANYRFDGKRLELRTDTNALAVMLVTADTLP